MIKNFINEKEISNNTLSLLNLEEFKVQKCNIINKHNHMNCIYYHNKTDYRRSYSKYIYNYILCKNFRNCIKEDKCKFAHNKIEILYHPNLYKKKFCKKYLLKGKCKYEKFCFFAHSWEELRINIIHNFRQNSHFFLFYYKTEFCPLGKIKHDLNFCVYSHNFQDYKRKNLFKIKSVQCKNWNNYTNYEFYDSGCPNGINCNYLHGWKESLFHPNNYKKKICKNKDCKKKLICSYLHKDEKKNIISKKFFTPNIKTIY